MTYAPVRVIRVPCEALMYVVESLAHPLCWTSLHGGSQGSGFRRHSGVALVHESTAATGCKSVRVSDVGCRSFVAGLHS